MNGILEERLFFPCGGLRLEGCLAYPMAQAVSGRVLICPPHPFLGGEMDNNVVSHLARHFAGQGMAVLRFNCRGIGHSATDRQMNQDLAAFWRDSTAPAFEAAIHDDCRAACAFLAGLPLSEAEVRVIGYSFGVLPALDLLAHEPAVTRAALIAPPLIQWTIPDAWTATPKHKVLLYATGDFSCPEEAVLDLARRLAPPKQVVNLGPCDHFFIGHEAALAVAVQEGLG